MDASDWGSGPDPEPNPLIIAVAALPVIAALLNYYAAIIPLLR